jgi:hypothetical protein
MDWSDPNSSSTSLLVFIYPPYKALGSYISYHNTTSYEPNRLTSICLSPLIIHWMMHWQYCCQLFIIWRRDKRRESGRKNIILLDLFLLVIRKSCWFYLICEFKYNWGTCVNWLMCHQILLHPEKIFCISYIQNWIRVRYTRYGISHASCTLKLLECVLATWWILLFYQMFLSFLQRLQF